MTQRRLLSVLALLASLVAAGMISAPAASAGPVNDRLCNTVGVCFAETSQLGKI
jgi:hypothetical protein